MKAQANLGYYRALVALLPEAVLACDHTGRLLEVNQRACELLGFDRKELLGRSIAVLAVGSEAPPAKPAAPPGLPTGEVLLKGKDGSLRPVEISMQSLPGDRRVFSLRDIRRQQEAEAELHRKTSELELYFENSLDLLCIANTAGQFVRLNPEWEKVLGYPLAELRGRSFMELVHPDDQASTLASITRLSAQQEVLRFTNRYRCKDGTCRWIEWNAHPAGDLIYAVARDITERKQADAALRHANRQLRMLNECNEALLYHSDETELLTAVCRIAVVTGGYHMAWVGFAENDPARTVRPVAWTGAEEGYLSVANVSWGESERGGGPIGIAIRSGRPCAIQDLLADPRCAAWWPEIRRHGYAASCALPLILDGRTLGALTIIASTTGTFDETETALLARLANNVAFGLGARRARAERARVEQALADETAWRRILVEQSRDGIVVLGGDGRVFEANRRFAEILGYSPEEISALHVWDWDAQWTRAQLRKIIQQQDQKGNFFASRHRRKDGSVLEVEVSSNGTVIGGRKFVLCVIRDITERKQAEEVLRRTQWSIDRARDALYWIDHNGRIFYVNEAACQELGYTRDELVRLTVMDIDPGFSANRWPTQWAMTRQLGAYTIETTHRAKDGHMIPVEVAINHIQFEGQEFHCAFARDISERKRAEAAVRASERRFRQMFEDTRAVMLLIDPDSGAIVEANPAAAEFYGYARETLRRMKIEDLSALPPEQVEARRTEVREGRKLSFVVPHRLASGELRSVEVRSSAVEIDGRRLFFAIIQDITERKRAEEALRHSEANLQLALEAARMGDWSWNIVTGEVLWSARCKALYGMSPDTVVTYERFLGCLHPDDRERVDAALRRAVAERSDYEVEKRVVWPDGSMHWTATRGRVFCDAAGKPVHVAGVTLDITERKRAEQALVAFRTTIETTGDAVFWTDPAGRIHYVNEQAVRELGYTREELLQMTLLDIDPDLTAERLTALWNTPLPPGADGRASQLETRHRRKDGTVFPVELQASTLITPGSKLSVSFARNITERKRAEQAERQINRHLLMLSECNEAVIRSSDEATLLQTVCRLMVEIGGYRGAWIGFAENDEGKTVRPVAWAGLDQDYVTGLRVSWADNENGQGPAAIAIRTGRPCPMQGVLDDPRFAPWQVEASKRGIAAICALPLAANGRVFGVLCIDAAQPAAFDAAETAILQEVADNLAFGLAVLQTRQEHQRAELALREAEALYRTVFQTSPDGMTLLDLEGRITFVSPMALEVYGLADPSAAVGRPFSDFIAPVDLAQARAKFASALANEFGHALQYTLQRGDGTTFVGEIKGARLRDAAGRPRGVLIITRDITERKRTEEMLRRVSKAVECASDAIGMADSQGRHFYQNKAFTDLFEYTTEEISASDESPAGYVDKNVAREVFAGIASGGSWSGEVGMRSKSGREFPVWLRADAIKDEGGRVIGLVGVHTDITGRKRAEQERLDLERRLLHTQKLESLGVLAGGIAHDFNNLLMAILGNLDLALMDTSPLSPARVSLEQGVNAARRAADLTRQMLAYSGRGSFDIRSLDLCELVTENVHLFRASISKLVTLQVENAAELPCIRADAGQIQQVVMNLITNASEAIGNHPGVVRLRTDVMDCDAATLRRNRGDVVPAPGRFVLLEVTDTGCGMDETTLQRLFEPFFTTKFTGRGLGMSALLGIVRGHRGAIFVDSLVGRGTTIQVLFPVDLASGETGSVRPRQLPPGSMPAGDRLGTVLIVDDEDVVRQVCKNMLVRRGWKVVEAADGPEAIELFQQQPDGIALVVLDLSMPKMSGIEVFRALRALRPNVRIILTSGYSSDQSSSAQLAAEGLAGFIQKPYTVQTLLHEVERALRRP